MAWAEALARDGDPKVPRRVGDGLDVSDGGVAAAVGEGGRAWREDGVEGGGGGTHGEAEREGRHGERLALDAGRNEEAEVGAGGRDGGVGDGDGRGLGWGRDGGVCAAEKVEGGGEEDGGVREEGEERVEAAGSGAVMAAADEKLEVRGRERRRGRSGGSGSGGEGGGGERASCGEDEPVARVSAGEAGEHARGFGRAARLRRSSGNEGNNFVSPIAAPAPLRRSVERRWKTWVRGAGASVAGLAWANAHSRRLARAFPVRLKLKEVAKRAVRHGPRKV